CTRGGLYGSRVYYGLDSW
nr:immunoglobulin heavy chain junction region [Macaca mulatta]MOX96429.1 immunoglobulin heavy chain junction region [Macaca mulatta]MOX96657.1 immunoglobulin heavy chain junction region [Macaca mulatta]